MICSLRQRLETAQDGRGRDYLHAKVLDRAGFRDFLIEHGVSGREALVWASLGHLPSKLGRRVRSLPRFHETMKCPVAWPDSRAFGLDSS